MQSSWDLGIQGLSKDIEQCRICSNKDLLTYLDLGIVPLANKLVKSEDLNNEEQKFPLNVKLCKKCFNSQLGNVVNPEFLFTEYPYRSSISQPFIEHCKSMAKTVNEKYQLSKADLVIDIASNDGCLLEAFKPYNVKVLGIDPAKNLAEIANKKGVETLPEFFTKEVAERVANKYGKAKLITATNVFAHVDDLNNFLSGVKTLLSNNGIFIIEVPHKKHLIEENQFDTIYHEHLSYLSLRPLKAIFERFDMQIIDAKKVDSHGGSLRVYVQKQGGQKKVQDSVAAFIDKERKLGLDNINTYLKFAKKIEINKKKLIKLLKKLKSQNKTLVGYGAPAKGNTLLNFYKIGPQILDYIVDDSKYKQGLYTPGTHIQVVPFQEIANTKPDYIFILAWNFANPLMDKLSDFKKAGGHFIIPVPQAKII